MPISWMALFCYLYKHRIEVYPFLETDDQGSHTLEVNEFFLNALYAYSGISDMVGFVPDIL